ncbi:hypothetical protein ACP275_12G173500 [Erythranthe tilingii]
MAQDLDDLEFLLPSELLTDDDLLTDFKIDSLKTRGIDDFPLGFGNSFGFDSDLSSPVESVTGTESDEFDFVTELSQKVSNSTLQDPEYTAKGLKLSSSPKSTLCGYKPGSRGSPNSVSGVSSPPDANDAIQLELLYAAAGEVARLQLLEETATFYSGNFFAPPPKRSPVNLPQQNPNLASGFYHNQPHKQARITYEQLQAAKFRQMKQYQMMNNWEQGIVDYQLQNRRNGGGQNCQSLSTAAWPTLQQSHHQQGSGMRSVFLGENVLKKERVGTGVFMPRRFCSNPTETTPRKTAGCSTALLPEKVVQRNIRPHPVMKQEFSLPQEWTY